MHLGESIYFIAAQKELIAEAQEAKDSREDIMKQIKELQDKYIKLEKRGR